jgi:hypothetical protein
VREWCAQRGGTPDDALAHLLERGGFPEPCLADDPVQADRWRAQYITDLVREDVLEFSRVHEIGTMRLFVELLRERVGLAAVAGVDRARSGGVAHHAEALPRHPAGAVHRVHGAALAPQHRAGHPAVAQGLLFRHRPGAGDDGLRFENAVAACC